MEKVFCSSEHLNSVKIIYSSFFYFPFTVGTFSIKLPKLHAGETFENLDLLTTLLAPKKKASLNIKPLIEVVGKCSLLILHIYDHVKLYSVGLLFCTVIVIKSDDSH